MHSCLSLFRREINHRREKEREIFHLSFSIFHLQDAHRAISRSLLASKRLAEKSRLNVK